MRAASHSVCGVGQRRHCVDAADVEARALVVAALVQHLGQVAAAIAGLAGSSS